MKNKLAFLVLLLLSQLGFSQVGINTTTPNAQLEIKSSNQAAPANNDGIIIPKIDAFPVTAPTTDQNGMLVFLTQDVGANLKGFYYWDFSTLLWKNVGGNSISGWALTGNSVAATDFIGTTNNQDIRFKRNGINAGAIREYNTAFGLNSLNPLSTGDGNTSFGTDNLSTNTSGFQNVAVGNGALKLNTTGFSNNAFGTDGLIKNTTGSDNNAFGFLSLGRNTTGNNNTAMGKYALSSNVIGNRNAAFGDAALYSSTGTNNTAFGQAALSNLTAGDNNIGIGSAAQVPDLTGSNQLSIANKIYGLDLNTATPKFGFNTAAPIQLLHLQKSSNADGGNDFMFFENTAAGGAGFQFKNTNASTNLWQAFLSSAGDFKIGRAGMADWITFKTVASFPAVQFFDSTASGEYSTAFGINSAASGQFSTAFGSHTSARSFAETTIGIYNTEYVGFSGVSFYVGDRLFVIGNGNASIRSNALNMLKNGNTRFGNGNPTARVDVEGEIKINSSGAAANAVGAGGMRWDGTNIQFSNGSAWANIDTATPAGWSLTGNSVTATDFIGTTNDQDIRFNRYSINAGVIKVNSTALGLNSLNPLSTGISNTAIGTSSLTANTSGSQNTAVGREALRFNTSGSQNTALGNRSLFTNVSGFRNSAFGTAALYNATGTQNTAIGHQALELLSTGDNNIGIGNNAQVAVFNDSNQLSIGNSIYGSNIGASNLKIGLGVSSPNGTLQFMNENTPRRIVFWENANNDHQYSGFGKLLFATDYHVGSTADDHVFSAGASATTSNELMRIKGAGNVGVGTDSPTAKLEIRQDALTTINSNVFRLTNFIVNGDNLGSSIVFGSGGTTATNQHWAKIDGFHSGAGNTNLTFATSTGANYEAATEKMRINGIGNVGIGIDPAVKADINGGLALRNTTTFTANSDNFAVNVGNSSYVFVVSDNASAANRTLVLSNGLAIGQMLFLQANSSASNFFSLTEGTSNVDFVGGSGSNFDFNGNDIIQLLWNGNDWILINYQNIT